MGNERHTKQEPQQPDSFNIEIIEKYQTIRKPVRVKPLWNLITTKNFK